METVPEYAYHDARPTHANAYLWPIVRGVAETVLRAAPRGGRAFDLGCGNGAMAGMLAEMGFDVVGVDTSASGVGLARQAHPQCRFDVASAYDDLAGTYGQFDFVVSLEVVEHLYDPRRFARRLFDLVAPDGVAVVSTPYHGYLKNLALALTGRMDAHFGALWDGGHIKFFSARTLGALMVEAGFEPPQIRRVGRVPPLAKSMIAVARRRGDSLRS